MFKNLYVSKQVMIIRVNIPCFLKFYFNEAYTSIAQDELIVKKCPADLLLYSGLWCSALDFVCGPSNSFWCIGGREDDVEK